VPMSDEKLLSDLSGAVDNIWLCFLGATVFCKRKQNSQELLSMCVSTGLKHILQTDMQAGFAMLEVGSIRVKNTKGLLVKVGLSV